MVEALHSFRTLQTAEAGDITAPKTGATLVKTSREVEGGDSGLAFLKYGTGERAAEHSACGVAVQVNSLDGKAQHHPSRI